MPFIGLEGFSGTVPRMGPTELTPSQAQISNNAKLQSGEIRPWRASTLSYTPQYNTDSIYYFRGPLNLPPVWLEWLYDVNVVSGPIADTTDYRLYFSSNSFNPRKTNWALATGNGVGIAPFPNAWYEMGVPAPTSAPVLSNTGSVAANSITFTSTQIATLIVGDILNITVDANAAVNVTLVSPITAASLVTQLASITTMTAVVSGSNLVLTTVSSTPTSQITIKKQTGTIKNYDPTVVTYSDLIALVNGTTGVGATATISSAQITAMAPADRFDVLVNNNAGVAITVNAGSGSYPSDVTAQSLQSALSTVYGITATINTGVSETVTVVTTVTGTSASLRIRNIIPRVDPVYTTLAQTSPSTAVTETRSYIYTHVTTFGAVTEESSPSPAALVVCNFTGDTVVVGSFSTPPTGNYNFTFRRIYRTVVGGNSTNYQFVAQIPISQTSYSDTLSVTQLGEILTSLYYTPPPTGLQGLVSMPNGMLVGFVGNQIWFCEPYLPHAWPSNYMLTTEYPIVGLGVYGNTLFVGTTRNPYVVSGTHPSSMMQEKMSVIQPCVSKKSIVSDQFGVMYASPNGLVSIGPGSQDVISTGLYTRDEWQALVPATIVGTVYNNMYIGSYLVNGTRTAFVLLRGDTPPLSNLSISARAMFIDHTSSAVYFLSYVDGKIYQLDADANTNLTYTWKSKKFVLPNPINFGAIKAQANYALLGSGKYVTINVYGDGTLVYTGNTTSQEPVRMPSLGKFYIWEIEFIGNIPLRRFYMSTSIGELRNIPQNG